ncbi:hypothetical protein T4C_1371 [Trichinella pseudospiralis]|uniref:Uncharacterized protein n=1 Tax=Trichinella pseudospiralis TaxID=6337 RepID=A0A0V1JTL5_TRIPS|nr:hypothetical protein T4C_1371 [Trichinella pseudospiralis]
MANQTLVPIRTVSDFYANIKPEECYPFKHTLCNITLSAFEKHKDRRWKPTSGRRRVTCSSSTGYTARAILTISNDESPYFQSSPLPHPVAVPEACRLARSPPWDQKQGQARLDCPCAAPRPPAL